MTAWLIATTSFWAAGALLLVLAVVDAVWSARRARRERREALRRIPIARRRRHSAERGGDPLSAGGKTDETEVKAGVP